VGRPKAIENNHHETPHETARRFTVRCPTKCWDYSQWDLRKYGRNLQSDIRQNIGNIDSGTSDKISI